MAVVELCICQILGVGWGIGKGDYTETLRRETTWRCYEFANIFRIIF